MISCYKSPVGDIVVECIDDVIISATLLDTATTQGTDNQSVVDFFDAYFNREWKPEVISFEQEGTDFEQHIWSIIQAIPFGSTKTYKQIAMQIGDEKYSRAVANAVGKNKLAIIVPCHRVVGTAGDLRGFAWGITRKKWLLDFECGQQNLF
ncbi:MAG: methylated-DNA--[protein]-cysteine S-methyltransferase [Chitinophagales bacterium]